MHCLKLSIVQYNNKSQYSIFFIDISFHSLYCHRFNNSIVFATHNLCCHQRRIKTHKIYIRGIIILYVSLMVILFHLQRAGLVFNILCGCTRTSSDTSCISQTLFHLGRTSYQSSSTLHQFYIYLSSKRLLYYVFWTTIGFTIHTTIKGLFNYAAK